MRTQDQIIKELEATIAQAKSQIEQLKQSKFTYPMWFKTNVNKTVVKFTGLNTIEVVTQGNGQHNVGFTSADCVPHTNRAIWTQVPEPIKQWEPQGGTWYITTHGKVINARSAPNTKLFGVEYKTEEQAEWASKQMRKFNRLLCYVAEFDIDTNSVQWSPDWGNSDFRRYHIAYSHSSNKWIYDWNEQWEKPMVHMSEQCAKDLVNKLNSGTIVL